MMMDDTRIIVEEGPGAKKMRKIKVSQQGQRHSINNWSTS